MPVDYRMLDTRLPERLGSLAKSIKMNVIAGKSRPPQNTLASLAQPQVQQEQSGLEDLGNGIMVDKNGAVQVNPERQASFDAWADNYNKMQFERQMLKDKAQQKPEKLQFSADAGGFIEPPSAQNPQGRIIPMPGFAAKSKPTAGESAVDKAFAKEYVEWNAAGGKSDVEKNIGQLRGVTDQLGRIDPKTGQFIKGSDTITGAVVGNTPDFVSQVFNPKAIAARDTVEEVVQRNLRLVLGAQFTEREGERLIARAFNPKLDEEENYKRVTRLSQAIQKAAESKEDASRYFEQNGTLKGWSGKSFNISDFEKAIEGGGASTNNIDALLEKYNK